MSLVTSGITDTAWISLTKFEDSGVDCRSCLQHKGLLNMVGGIRNKVPNWHSFCSVCQTLCLELLVA